MALLYEALLLSAVLFFFGFAFQGAASGQLSDWQLLAFKLYIFLVIGLYFIWCWLRGGQTLAMKTWRLKLECVAGGKITPQQALARYILAWFSLMFAGLGFLWAFVDPDRQFLHDRLASTRIIRQKP
jgi:uncharacterized RDD family membrane protein YckC